ncbi:MAG: 1-(5-phosphoribosyl)-5-[(5-phosphoribosylamino)methylideneamino]imidazole-4-carboxamide isomerase [bacterium]|nr:1-(5-phosphoribosyl)-5-[(5-phosphoribosylamino)methylideneamino]imidazole-4-carboxamide isomerase [bacterium]
MQIIPAIDILEGQCVRLQQGEYSRKTVYSDDPVSVAKRWESAGAKWLHIVDLDGAKTGSLKNLDTVVRIVNAVTIPVELGGGIRDLASIKQVLSLGIQRVVLGTIAYSYAAMVEEACNRFGEKIAVGIDARHGRVMIKGWLEKTDIPALDLAKRMENSGVKTIIYTDISKDGMLEGPNLAAIKHIACNVGISVIASGGIATINDIQNLKQLGCPNLIGAIVGKAIYDGQLDLHQAILAAG